MSRVMILLGMPGAGKGTQSALISKKLGLPIVSIGDVLREKAKQDNKLGQIIKRRMASGLLMSQDIINEVICEQITLDHTTGLVLDGYPRDIHQGLWFDRWSAHKGLSLIPLNLSLSEDTAK